MKLKDVIFGVMLSTGVLSIESSFAESTLQPEIDSVTNQVQKLIDSNSISGAIVMVQQDGHLIHHSAQGLRDVDEKSILRKDDIVRIYSMTKPITTVAALMLVEEGMLDLDAPVTQYLPEFSSVKVLHKRREVEPNTPMTIRHLMTHSAGLTYGFFSNTAVDKQYNKNHPLYSKDNAEMVDKLVQHPLIFHPGEKWHYSVATDVLGHVVERVTDQTLGQFFTERIFVPLNMVDTGFSIPNEQLSRFTSVYDAKGKLHEKYNQSYFQMSSRIESGGGGLVSTAQDYMNFCQMLLNGGEFQGKRLLKEKTVQQMTENQLPDGVLAYGLFGFGLGVRVQLSDWGHKAHVGEYGWNGAASTHFWISPKDELIVIALSQRQPYSNQLSKSIKPLIYRSIQ